MADHAHGRVTRDVAEGVTPVRAATLAAVVLFAAGYFTIGIRLALGWALGWIDSGLVVYGSWRVADGAVPYRDFDHVYGPSLFYLNGALLRLFGDDLAVVSAGLLALKVVLVALVFALARRVATVPIAGVSALLLVVVWGSPLWLFSSPYAQHYGTVCALIGLLVAATDRPTRRTLVVAGLWVGVAATFKITSGLFALMGLVLWVLGRRTARADEAGAAARAVRAGTAGAVLALGVLYGIGSLPAGADAVAVATVAVVVLPFALAAGAVLRDELRGGRDGRGAVDVVLLAGAAAIPLLAWGVFFVAQGAGDAFVKDILRLPPRLRWFEPLQTPSATAVLIVVAVLCAVAAARSRAWLAAAVIAVVAAVGLALATRPPATPMGIYLARHALGRIAFDVIGYLPLLSVVVTLPRMAGLPPLPRLYFLFAATNVLLLMPAADIWHGFLTLPTAMPLVAWLLASRPRPGTRLGRALAAAPVALLLVVAIPFVVQLATTRQAWRPATARFERATGITHPDPKFDDVAALVRHLETEPGRARPLLLLTAEAMIYFLAGRESGFEHEEYLLQTLVRGAASPESTALLTEDADFARRIETERPLVVDEAGRPGRAALARFLPRTAAVLDGYRPGPTFGRYVVLEP